jgi:cytochrome P450
MPQATVDFVASSNPDPASLPALDWSGEYQRDPSATVSELRARSSIARTDTGYVVLTGAEAPAVLRQDFPISTYHIPASASPYLAERTKEPLLSRYGPQHRELRRILTRLVAGRLVEKLRPEVRAIFEGLLAKVLDKGECDLVTEVFDPYPALVFWPMLGIPPEDIPDVVQWVSESARWTDTLGHISEVPGIEQAWKKLEDYLGRILAVRRKQQREDIFSALIRAMEGYQDKEIIGVAAELTRASLDTTRRQLRNTMYAFLQHAGQWAKLAASPDLAGRAVEEGLRYRSIKHVIARTATEPCDLNGIPVQAGQVVAVLVPAVNHDPDLNENPADFDIARGRTIHYTFGGGSHSCVGAPLARIEMTEAFNVLATKIGSWELAGPVAFTKISEGSVPTALPVRFTLKT